MIWSFMLDNALGDKKFPWKTSQWRHLASNQMVIIPQCLNISLARILKQHQSWCEIFFIAPVATHRQSPSTTKNWWTRNIPNLSSKHIHYNLSFVLIYSSCDHVYWINSTHNNNYMSITNLVNLKVNLVKQGDTSNCRHS